MTSPLSFLGKAIEQSGNNASVLPASEGAFEGMARSDVEKADDYFFGGKNYAKDGFQDFAETPALDSRYLYRPTPRVFRPEKHDRFEPQDKGHHALADNNKALHEATAADDTTKPEWLEYENLEFDATHWGSEKPEGTDIKASLMELE